MPKLAILNRQSFKRKWEKHYSIISPSIDRVDYLKQVGHTVHGESISHAQFESMTLQIEKLLELQSDDMLLDLCCGNGLITNHLSKKCKKVVGVDFSTPLLEIANEDHISTNIKYKHLNLLDRNWNEKIGSSEKFTKILMYGSLQHFTQKDLGYILENIQKVSATNKIILLGFIPDDEKKWYFYNTIRRKFRYSFRRFIGGDMLGTWWKKNDLKAHCDDLGLKCTFHDLPKNLHANIYRFNAKLSPKSTAK